MKFAIVLVALVVAVAADLGQQQPIEQRQSGIGEQGQRRWQNQGMDSNVGQQQRPFVPQRFRRAIDKEGVKDTLNRGVDKAVEAGQDMKQGLHDAKEDIRRTRRDTITQGVKDSWNRGVDTAKSAGQDVKQGFQNAGQDVRRARDTLGQGQGTGQHGFEHHQGYEGKVLGQQQGLDQQQQVRAPRQMQRIVDIRQPRQMQRIVDIRQPREYMFDEY